MTKRKARQLAYSVAASLCQAEVDNSTGKVHEVLVSNGYADVDQGKVLEELADIVRQLAYLGREVKR